MSIKKTRRTVALFLMVILCVAGVATQVIAAKKLLVFHYPRDYEIERIQAVIESFNKTHPDVKVEAFYGWFSKMDVAIAGGMVPDIIISDPMTVPTLMGKGYLMSIDHFMQADKAFSIKHLLPASVEMLRWQGRLVGIPINMSLKGLLYNLDIFDQAGLSYPDDSWTWNSYITFGKKMVRDTNADRRMDQFGMDMAWGNHSYWPAWVYQSGGDFWDSEYSRSIVATPEFARAVEFVSDLVNEHGIAARVAGSKILEEELSGFDGGSLFRNQRAGMTWGSNELIGQSPFDPSMRVGLARMPMGPASRANLINGDFVGIYRHSKEPDLAWEFLKTTVAVCRQRHLTGQEILVPVDREALQRKFELPQFRAAPAEVFYQLALDARPNTLNHPASNSVYRWGWDVLGEKLLAGQKMPVMPMLEDLQRQVNAELEGARAKGFKWGW